MLADREDVSYGDVPILLEIQILMLHEMHPDRILAAFFTGNFARRTGPNHVCFKTKAQAQAFIELNESELQVDLTALDKTIVRKMYINTNLKDYAATAMLAVMGY